MTQLLKDQLQQKLIAKTANSAVIGLGYVGLPLAVEMAKAGYKVTGFDIQERRVDQVNQGIYPGKMAEDQEFSRVVKEGLLYATSDFSYLRDIDVVTICVPTPLDIYQQPDISYVRTSSEEIAQHLHRGMLVVLESTTYPGTTEELIKPILESTGLRCGEDFFLAYSPERVDPGNNQYTIKNTPKVVGGVTSACRELASDFYRQVLEGPVHTVSSPSVAEMEKILENTFRNINVALINEMAILCKRMNIDIWEVIDAAKTKPYGFMAFYPGPGLGGHCIPVDPWYLTWKAREFNYHTRLIEVAGEINNSMPEFVVERIGEILNEQAKPYKGSNVYLLGVAYKKDVDDYRESPVLAIIELLRKKGTHVIYSDPKIPSFQHKGYPYQTVELTEHNLASVDLVVITTDHTAFDYNLIGEYAPVLFDTRNAMRDKQVKHKYYRL